MESIVSPWFVYVLGLTDSLIILFGMIAVIGIVISGIAIAILSEHTTPEDKKTRRIFIRVLIGCALIGITAPFIPSRNTLIGMYVANEITYDRVQTLTKAGIELKEEIKADIIDILKEVGKEKK